MENPAARMGCGVFLLDIEDAQDKRTAPHIPILEKCEAVPYIELQAKSSINGEPP